MKSKPTLLIIAGITILVLPFLIFFLFIKDSDNVSIFEASIIYAGTAFLGLVAVYQNQVIRDDTNKNKQIQFMAGIKIESYRRYIVPESEIMPVPDIYLFFQKEKGTEAEPIDESGIPFNFLLHEALTNTSGIRIQWIDGEIHKSGECLEKIDKQPFIVESGDFGFITIATNLLECTPRIERIEPERIEADPSDYTEGRFVYDPVEYEYLIDEKVEIFLTLYNAAGAELKIKIFFKYGKYPEEDGEIVDDYIVLV